MKKNMEKHMNKQKNFSLLEILDLAQKIEDKGERFYRSAAAKFPKHKKFLLAMANQEKGHKTFFKDIKHNVQSSEDEWVNDPDGVIKSHLDAIAAGLIFDTESYLDDYSSDDIEEVMDAAIDREEETILFFRETKKLLKGKKDIETIEDLINEEMSHIEWINEQRKNLPQQHPLL